MAYTRGYHRSVRAVRLLLFIGVVTLSVATGRCAYAKSEPYILLQAETFDGLGTDPTKEWAVSNHPGDKGLYGNFKVAVVAEWTVNGIAISKEFDVPQKGTYAVWVRHFNLKSDKADYNLNFLVCIMQEGEIVFEHRFAMESKGGWDVWLWDQADRTVSLREGKAKVVIIATDGAQHHRGVDAVLLTQDLSLDPNQMEIPL